MHCSTGVSSRQRLRGSGPANRHRAGPRRSPPLGLLHRVLQKSDAGWHMDGHPMETFRGPSGTSSNCGGSETSHVHGLRHVGHQFLIIPLLRSSGHADALSAIGHPSTLHRRDSRRRFTMMSNHAASFTEYATTQNSIYPLGEIARSSDHKIVKRRYHSIRPRLSVSIDPRFFLYCAFTSFPVPYSMSKTGLSSFSVVPSVDGHEGWLETFRSRVHSSSLPYLHWESAMLTSL